MKKAMVVLGILGLSSLSVPMTGLAAEQGPVTPTAETPAQLKSDVSLTIEAGKLTLDKVPDFNFGTKSIKEISETLGHTVISNPETDPAISEVSVSDYRGQENNSWKLTAQLSTIKKDSTNMLHFAELSLNTATSNNSDAVIATGAVLGELHGEQIVATAQKTDGAEKGAGKNTFEFTNAALTIEQAEMIAGEYKGTITWKLYDSYQPQ